MLATAQTAIAVIGIDSGRNRSTSSASIAVVQSCCNRLQLLSLASRMTREGADSATKTTSRHRFTPYSPAPVQ